MNNKKYYKIELMSCGKPIIREIGIPKNKVLTESLKTLNISKVEFKQYSKSRYLAITKFIKEQRKKLRELSKTRKSLKNSIYEAKKL
jgi:hypothetical protein